MLKNYAVVCSVVAGLAPAAGFAQADQGHDVTIILPDSIDNLDPCRSARNDVGRIIKQNIVETLTVLDPEVGSVQPLLATEWEQLDEDTWRFRLRDGVTFHDGSELNAEAVVAAIKRTLNPDLDCTVEQKFFGGIELDAVAADDLTVDVTANPPQPILPTMMTTLTISAPSTPFGEPTNEPVGTGPYVLEEWQPGLSASLVRFEDYWGERPEVEKATFLHRADSAVQAAMVETGEADLAPYVAVQDANNPETDRSYLNTETAQVALTYEQPPLDDVRVRRALNLGVDRQAFIGTIFGPDVQVASQIVTPQITGYNPNIEPWPYDPVQAKQLIEEARAEGVPVDAEITLYGRPGFLPNQSDVLQALAQMWQDIGLNVRVQMIEKAQFIDLVSLPHEENRPPAMFFNLHDNSRGDAGSSLYFKYSSDGGQSQTVDPELDALIDTGLSTTGESRSGAFQQAFDRITNDLVADVVLFHFVGYARVGPGIEYSPTPLTNNEIHLSDISLTE